MPESLTCELVEERGLDGRYVAGTLPEAEAREFEAHYFGCGVCWERVQRGLTIRAAFADAGAPAAVLPMRPARWSGSRMRRWGLAAAALLVVGVGLWRLVGPRQPAPGDGIRGGDAALSLTLAQDQGAIVAHWPPLKGAQSYHLRLFSPDGGLVFERELTDTLLRLPTDSLSTPSGRPALGQVEALDGLRVPLGRSALIPIPSSPGP